MKDTLELLQKWNEKSKAYRTAHYNASVRLKRMHYLLGLPTIIFSSIVGTTVFATLEKAVEIRWRVVVGIISVAAAILAGVQTFFRFSERAEAHRQAFAGYDSVVRQIEQLLVEVTSGISKVERIRADVDRIRKRLDDFAHAPELSDTDRSIASGRGRLKGSLPSSSGIPLNTMAARVFLSSSLESIKKETEELKQKIEAESRRAEDVQRVINEEIEAESRREEENKKKAHEVKEQHKKIPEGEPVTVEIKRRRLLKNPPSDT